MRNVIFALIIFLEASNVSKAQFIWAEVGIDGLTCSACSRSVEMSIRKLDFVDSVIMNLEHTEGKIIFKKSSKIEIVKIGQAIVNAGFSVRYLKAAFIFNDIQISNDYQFTYENSAYRFITLPKINFQGETILTFIDKNYLSKKEFSHWKNELKKLSYSKKDKKYYITS